MCLLRSGWAVLLAGWASVHAAEYHVDTGGDDAAAGTVNAPWRTLQKAARKARSGDTVIVRAGTYAGPLAPARGGTEQAPVVFRAAENMKVVIQKPKVAKDSEPEGAIIHLRGEGGSWTRSSGFVLDGQAGRRHFGGGRGVWIDGAEHVIVEDCEILRTRWAVRGARGDAVTFRRLRVHDNRFGFTLGEKGDRGVTRVVIEDAESHDNGDPTRRINSDGFLFESGCTGLVLRRCRAWNNHDSGFDLKPPGSVVDSCVAHHNGSQGFKLWYQDNLVTNCISYANDWAGFVDRGGNTRFYHCVAYRNRKLGWRVTGQPVFRNCIVGRNDFRFDTRRQDSTGPVEPDFDYTLFYKCSEQKEGDGTYNFVRGPHCVVDEDPRFVAPDRGDFRLGRDSPCIDAGVALPDVRTDLDGRPRRAGVAPDIGAYESPHGG